MTTPTKAIDAEKQLGSYIKNIHQTIQVMEINKKNKCQVKTRPPISVVLLTLINLIFIIQSISNWVWIIYSVPFNLVFYIQFCRYCCMVTLTREFINIQYLNPLLKSRTIMISDIKSMDYEKSFYDFFSRKTIGGTLFLPQYCFDRLILRLKDAKESTLYINVNMLIFDFDKILKGANELKILAKI